MCPKEKASTRPGAMRWAPHRSSATMQANATGNRIKIKACTDRTVVVKQLNKLPTRHLVYIARVGCSLLGKVHIDVNIRIGTQQRPELGTLDQAKLD